MPARKRKTASPVVIRLAQPGDVEGILAIEESSFEYAPERFHRRQIRNLICLPSASVFVAVATRVSPLREQGVLATPALRRGLPATRVPAVLGWGAALVRKGRSGTVTGRVYAVAVDPAARGLGIGRRLMERMLKALKTRGAGRVFLEVRADNASAVALYRKLGFADHKGLGHYYGPGRHGLRMVRA